MYPDNRHDSLWDASTRYRSADAGRVGYWDMYIDIGGMEMTTYTSDNGSAIHIVCGCHSAEHQIYFVHDEDPEWEYFYIHVHLTAWENWFQRLWAGIRYIFGHRSKYGDWDEIIINPNDARHLVDFLNSKLPITDVPPVAGDNDA